MKVGRYTLDIIANKVGIRVFERYVSLMTSPFRLRVSRTGSKAAGFIQNRYLRTYITVKKKRNKYVGSRRRAQGMGRSSKLTKGIR